MRNILLFTSGDDQLNIKAENELSRLKDVNISIVDDTKPIEKNVNLPFIQVDNGVRYFGIDSINAYAHKQQPE